MRKLTILLAFVGLLALPACMSSRPYGRVTITPLHRTHLHARACVSGDCGPYAANVTWQGITIAGRTGYYIYLNGSQVADVTASPYAYYGADCGTTFTIGVAAHDGVGTTGSRFAASYTTPACVGGVPGSLSAPLITSTAPQIQGNTLNAGTGTWTNTPTSYAYQWQRCDAGGKSCANIGGATSSAYTLGASDVGVTDVVQVSATNGSGTTQASSIATGMPGVSGAHTYYISETNGSDSNSGTSTAAPWQHAPGMAICTSTCASYSHVNGDRFIFEGGDTWPNSVFPLNDASASGGSLAAPDYYGVETDWFIGATFTRPYFSACTSGSGSACSQGVAMTGSQNEFIDISFRDNIWVDDITFTGFFATLNYGLHLCDVINVYDGGNASFAQHEVINRINVPNFFVNPTTGSGDCSVALGETGPPWGGSTIIENSTMNIGATAGTGRAVFCLPQAVNNTISGFVDGIFPCGHGQVSGNDIGNCGIPQPAGISGYHENAIESLGSDGAYYMHDNVIHDTANSAEGECESMIIGNTGESDYVYNNVFYNLAGNHPGIPQTSGSFPSDVFFWNNTIEAKGDSGDCAGIDGTRTGGGSPTISYGFQNNLCITNSPTAASGAPNINDGAGFAAFSTVCGTASCPIDHNVAITPAAAASDGYTSTAGPFVWTPPVGASPTNGTGVNLTAQCSASIVLCSDTTYAGARTALSRPGAGAWDVGAYEVP